MNNPNKIFLSYNEIIELIGNCFFKAKNQVACGPRVGWVAKQTEFLVISAKGNPCWAFSCYGRKVEKAVKLRKKGHAIVIVHESDFWDAVEDHEG